MMMEKPLSDIEIISSNKNEKMLIWVSFINFIKILKIFKNKFPLNF